MNTLSSIVKDRNLPIGAARLILSKPVYFGAMMVKTGDADAMVGGNCNANRRSRDGKRTFYRHARKHINPFELSS